MDSYGGSAIQAHDKVALSADGVPIHYDVHGSGTTALVFVHGWCCDRSYWDGQVGHFAPRHTVVRLDLAGHGASGKERALWTMPAFGEDVVAVVEQLGLEQAVLIGHSMGGSVIVEAARRIPASVIGLVGADTWRDVEHVQPPGRIAELVAPFRADFTAAARAYVRSMFVPTSDPALVGRVTAAMSSAPPHIGTGAFEAAWEHDRQLRAGLLEAQAPKFAINARRTNLEAAGRHGITVMRMSGVGHFVMLEDTQTFNGLLDEAVQQCLQAGMAKGEENGHGLKRI